MTSITQSLEKDIREQMLLLGLMYCCDARPRSWHSLHLAAKLMELAAAELSQKGDTEDAAIITRSLIMLDRIGLANRFDDQAAKDAWLATRAGR